MYSNPQRPIWSPLREPIGKYQEQIMKSENPYPFWLKQLVATSLLCRCLSLSLVVSLVLMEDWYHAFVGSIGKLWRLNRRRLRPGVRDAFAQLLLEIRIDYLPDEHLDSVSNIGHSRYDIRGVTELMGYVADRTRVSAAPLSVDSSALRSPLGPCATDQARSKH